MADRPQRVLILGGTAEAAALARHLDGDRRYLPTTSLAGRTRRPAPIAGAVRTGGFGGADGLADYLRSAAVDLLVDATHPYAATISRNAADAADRTGVSRLILLRPPWRWVESDRWIEVDDTAAAADALADLGDHVFLSIGRQTLAPFAALPRHWFLVRLIDPPAAPVALPRHRVVLGRGPFDADAEARLFAEHRIDVIVSKNSGGDATYGKIAAARRLGLPVIVIARPPPPAGDVVDSIDAAMAWLAAQVG
ncbi:MAG: cobalt-precorrin-6A reductase [Alphaproteobacteria bacterium]